MGSVNGFQNRWEFQNKEKESTFGLNRVNFGARTYNATIGRFDRIDRFSEKYVGLSTFQYTNNNPANLIDINGDSLGVNYIQGGGTNGRDLYQLSFTGKVVDNTTNGLSQKQLANISGQISRQFVNSFTGKDKNVEFSATANISVESSTNQLVPSDHAIRIVDDVATAVGQVDPPGGNIEGYGKPQQNYVYIEKGASYGRTGTHELGHSFGLGHIKDLTQTLSNGTTQHFTTNDYYGNLMHQSQDMNSQGQPVAGTRIESFQVKYIYKLYSIPALNRGRQIK